MKYQIICTETKLSPVVQKNIIDKLEKVEKMLYTSEEFDCRIVVKFRNNKRAQMSDEEVESDEQLLLISLDDMLKCRKEGLAKLNEKFGLDVSVELNPRFNRENYIKKESIKNE